MRRRSEPLPTVEEALYKYWGYVSFRPMQREIIDNILAGRDTLALLPTGGGKSLTYQIPALTMEGTCIVVTPLIALMKDQVDRLRAMGVSAASIHSGLSYRSIDIVLDNCIYGDIKILYVAPERLQSSTFLTRLSKMKVSILAVDEAHCISQWGYDFRPSYLKIGDIRERLSGTPILALTASATERVCDDIMQNLKFKQQNLLVGSFARQNLSYVVRETSDKNDMLLRVLSNVKGTAIVYCRTRKECEKVSEMLNMEGYTSTYYHGGLPNAERNIRQDEWVDGECRIMVATNAFGMGIDKPDVRAVVHYTLCDSLEAYYQEAGRAGRDGERSYAVLLIAPNDNSRVIQTLENEFPSLELIKSIYDKIGSKLQIPYGEGGDATYAFHMLEFARDIGQFSTTVLNALKILQMNGYVSYLSEMARPTQIIFVVSRDDLYRVRVKSQSLDSFIRILLRTYDGIFTEFKSIDETYIATLSGYTVRVVKEKLRELWLLRLIKYIPTNYTSIIYFDTDRVPIDDIYISPESYKYRKDLYTERLKKMIEYGENRDQCRSQMLEQYFGIKGAKECGACDICLKRRGSQVRKLNKDGVKESILEALSVKAYSIKELMTLLQREESIVVDSVDDMLRDEILVVNRMGKLEIGS